MIYQNKYWPINQTVSYKIKMQVSSILNLSLSTQENLETSGCIPTSSPCRKFCHKKTDGGFRSFRHTFWNCVSHYGHFFDSPTLSKWAKTSIVSLTVVCREPCNPPDLKKSLHVPLYSSYRLESKCVVKMNWDDVCENVKHFFIAFGFRFWDLKWLFPLYRAKRGIGKGPPHTHTAQLGSETHNPPLWKNYSMFLYTHRTKSQNLSPNAMQKC